MPAMSSAHAVKSVVGSGSSRLTVALDRAVDPSSPAQRVGVWAGEPFERRPRAPERVAEVLAGRGETTVESWTPGTPAWAAALAEGTWPLHAPVGASDQPAPAPSSAHRAAPCGCHEGDGSLGGVSAGPVDGAVAGPVAGPLAGGVAGGTSTARAASATIRIVIEIDAPVGTISVESGGAAGAARNAAVATDVRPGTEGVPVRCLSEAGESITVALQQVAPEGGQTVELFYDGAPGAPPHREVVPAGQSSVECARRQSGALSAKSVGHPQLPVSTAC